MTDITQTLRVQADEIAAAWHAGWGNTMQDAASEIDRLRAALREIERRVLIDPPHDFQLLGVAEAARAALGE